MSRRRALPAILAVAFVTPGCGGASTSLDAPPVVESTSVATSVTTAVESAPVATSPTAAEPVPAPTTDPTDEPAPPVTVDTTAPPVTAVDVASDWLVADPVPLELNEWRDVPDLGIELYLQKAEPYVGDWVGREFEEDPDEFPATVLWGTPTLTDPFSEGDFELSAEYNPHDDDYHVVDASNENSFETLIGGRTAQVTRWVVSEFADESVGFRIFWDADPDHYVSAASRTMTLAEMGEVLATVTFDADGVSIDGGRFGLEPMPVRWEPYYFAGDDYFSLKSGFYAGYEIEELVDDDEDGEDAEMDFWLIDGDIDDITVHRFLAASEQIVSVRGSTGYLLEGLNLWSDYPHTALVWQETPGVIGLMNVDEPHFGPIMVELADRTDLNLMG